MLFQFRSSIPINSDEVKDFFIRQSDKIGCKGVIKEFEVISLGPNELSFTIELVSHSQLQNEIERYVMIRESSEEFIPLVHRYYTDFIDVEASYSNGPLPQIDMLDGKNYRIPSESLIRLNTDAFSHGIYS